MNVVIVHGFVNNALFMRPMARHLTAAGHTCHVPTLTPFDARPGLVAMAAQLRGHVKGALPDGAPFAIVAFSMGALVARYYLQELGGHERAKAFYSIAGPHKGARYADFYPGAGTRDMRPKSAFLRDLDRSSSKLQGLPQVCYWTPNDVLIHPAEAAVLCGAESVQIPSFSHALMLLDKRLFTEMEGRLALLDQSETDARSSRE
ncbi:MAG: esterase/lipase family protein [Roseimicrobium sp.]